MGGIGSGRKPGGGKFCTSDCLHVDVRDIDREGLLSPDLEGCTRWHPCRQLSVEVPAPPERDWLTLIVRHQTDQGLLHYRQHVTLARTPCHFGGDRPWFRCARLGCFRKVAVLYVIGATVCCRRCANLAYQSQRQTRCDRAEEHLLKINGRLGWPEPLFAGMGPRAPRMRRRTYRRLQDDFLYWASVFAAEVRCKLGPVQDDFLDEFELVCGLASGDEISRRRSRGVR